MKKIYQAPETQLFRIVTASAMLTTSNGIVEDGFNKDDVDTTDETSGNLSRRRRDIWDDEDEQDVW